jgi:hypothetical protein
VTAAKKARSWDHLAPVQVIEWEEVDGLVHLLVPRFGRGRIAARLQRFLRQAPYRVHLDDVGSFIWKRCDGRTRVDEIGRALRQEFGDRVDPVEKRLVVFIGSLMRGKFVRMVTPAGTNG